MDKKDYKIQSVLFRKSHWKPEEIIEWLNLHNFKVKKMDITENYYRCRQYSPAYLKQNGFNTYHNKFIDNNDENHNGEAVKDVYVIESWIKEDENDKSIKYGYKDLPIGTWFVSMKVNNPEIWKKIKDKSLNGFSVSGFFEESKAFSKEDAFLFKVVEVLKNIKA